ncbi:MAG: hypothetical protein H6931_08960 [Burkholderiaceae bacterium]|nr:hypothetical protein [Burkholderiaceae bacterium]
MARLPAARLRAPVSNAAPPQHGVGAAIRIGQRQIVAQRTRQVGYLAMNGPGRRARPSSPLRHLPCASWPPPASPGGELIVMRVVRHQRRNRRCARLSWRDSSVALEGAKRWPSAR